MFAVVAAAAVSLALVGTALAQGAPPVPPHKFFGSDETGSAALLDGEAAADGAVVTATDQDGAEAGTSEIANGTWVIDVDSSVSSVSFSIDGSGASDSFDISSGSFSEVTLDLSAGGGGGGTTPGGLPSTGSGGLAGSGSSAPVLPLALMAVAVLAISGVAVTRRSQR
jgi:hypothetical protein